MSFINSTWLVFVFILSGLLFSQQVQAKPTSAPIKIQSQSKALTKAIVRDYINTSVAIIKLQEKMKGQAGQYENVIQSFYKKREAFLKSKGWTVEEFENTQERILAAQYALEKNADFKSEKEFNKKIAEIESNSIYTAKQKSGIIEIERHDRKHTLEEIIKPTKPDWPAVKAYQKELEHLTDYAAQNRSDPPVVK